MGTSPNETRALRVNRQMPTKADGHDLRLFCALADLAPLVRQPHDRWHSAPA